MERVEAEPVRVIGVEHEYRVLDPDGTQVDFRELITTLSIPGGGLDPGDPNGHHLPSGVLLTADGKEGEVATPPVPVRDDCLRLVSAWSERAEDELLHVLPAGYGIEGFSTHLNVAVAGDAVEIARRFAQHFGRAMSMLVDHADSPGLLVRPRRGRLELGGDFIEGAQLRAALDFAIRGAAACERNELPDLEPSRLVRAKDRPGWFLAHEHTPVEVLGRARAFVGASVEPDPPLPRDGVTGQDRFDLELDSPFARLAARPDVVAVSWAAVAFRRASTEHVVVPRAALAAFLDGGEAPGVRVVTGAFDPTVVIPPEPYLPGPWWRALRLEIAGALAGIAVVLAIYVAYAR